MKENSQSNIFDFAAKKKGAPKKVIPPRPATATPPPTPKEKNPLQDTEVTNMLERMNFMRRDIEKKLEEMYSKSGMSPSDIDTFLNNPRNVGTPLWEKMQQQKSQVADRIRAMVGIEQKTRSAIEKHKEMETEIKKRKSKLLGSRKKWIPIK